MWPDITFVVKDNLYHMTCLCQMVMPHGDFSQDSIILCQYQLPHYKILSVSLCDFNFYNYKIDVTWQWCFVTQYSHMTLCVTW